MNCTLPPRHLRKCGAVFQDDEHFFRSAEQEADRLVTECSLTSESVLMDFGCGAGRLAIGIESIMGHVHKYIGVDVDENALTWARKRFPGGMFDFRISNAHNARYNNQGVRGLVPVPVEDDSCDVVYSYSVFTHMVMADVLHYLREFRRVLKDDGCAFFTAHTADDVPEVEVNPDNYPQPVLSDMRRRGALHCVRYRTDVFVGLLKQAGLSVRNTSGEWHSQTGYYCVPDEAESTD